MPDSDGNSSPLSVSGTRGASDDNRLGVKVFAACHGDEKLIESKIRREYQEFSSVTINPQTPDATLTALEARLNQFYVDCPEAEPESASKKFADHGDILMACQDIDNLRRNCRRERDRRHEQHRIKLLKEEDASLEAQGVPPGDMRRVAIQCELAILKATYEKK
jgi:hypothetical protein